MRFILAGIILCAISSLAFAQAEGEVESIGFDGFYRPNCWTAMRLRLRPTIGSTQTYKLAIVQEDLDRDRVLYTRPFTLNGNSEGGKVEEKVWVYFRPQPRDLGGTKSARELSNIIKVFVCTEAGKQLVQIPIPPGTSLPKNIDDPANLQSLRGVKLILVVGSSASKPLLDIYGGARGMNEEITFVRVSPADLPGSVLAYEGVDGILWLDSDPGELRTDVLAAVEDYVRDGGKLVVSQSSNWQKMKESAFAAMLPVSLEGMGEEKGAMSLRLLADLWEAGKILKGVKRTVDPWIDLQDKKIPIAKATAKPGSVVAMFCVNDPELPYLVRNLFGLGTVTWVAQDFGDPNLISKTPMRQTGWAKVWDRTFDWHNNTRTYQMSLTSPEYKTDYEAIYGKQTGSTPDISTALLGKMELPQRGAALVAIAVVFFIGYWLIAGPGSYFFLLARKQAHFSWLAFAGCAVLATIVTVGVVKLVLRGPPQVQHMTFVRVGPDLEAVVHSQFGLYIPRDGVQRISLKETAAKRDSYVTPFPLHPDHVFDSSEYPAYLEYEVSMRDRTATDAPTINVPFRSTLKKFQAKWIGQMPTIDGRASLVDVKLVGPRLAGKLSNNTGHDLHSVYLIYAQSPGQGNVISENEDIVISLPDARLGTVWANGQEGPAWPNGKTIDLAELKLSQNLNDPTSTTKDMVGERGVMNKGWAADVWSSDLKNHQAQANKYDNFDRALVLLSIYDRLLPSRGSKDQNVWGDRYEILRRAGRDLDASGAVSAGYLLILARSDGTSPVPYPLEIEGEIVKGEGITYYQFIVPLDRTGSSADPIKIKQEEEGADAPKEN